MFEYISTHFEWQDIQTLKVTGQYLTDQSGNIVQLKGISTHGLAWFPQYVNEDCFRDFSQLGANVIRLAMYTQEYGGYCSGGDRNALKQMIRNGVQYAKNNHMYVIIDWHILSDGNPLSHMEEAKQFFDEMSMEFKNDNHILYEICNEPNGSASWQDIRAYADQIIPIIRKNKPDSVILVGTPQWSQLIDQAKAAPLPYENIMYTMHFYAATHREDFQNKLESMEQAGLPVFISEFGICDASGNGGIDTVQAEKWMRIINKYHISYVAWNLSNKVETSAVLNSSCTKVSGFTKEDFSPSGLWLINQWK